VAKNVCFMYTHNAKRRGWFDEVHLIVWGPSDKLLVLIAKTGREMPPGQIIAEPGQKGVLLEPLGPGRHFINPFLFERQLRPWATKKLVWDPAAVAELEGLFAGMRARCGPQGLLCRPLARALTLEDLYAANAVADWFGPACSGFTAWGALTSDGQVLHGRNLDFPMGARAQANQVILAVDALPAQDGQPGRRLAWVGVGWPGLICVYSAMNAEGLVCCLHDAVNVVTGGAKDGLVPRGLLLRRMVETLDPAAADPAAAAAKLAAERPVACGNLFHLSWPRAAAEKTQTAPTAILEFDAQGRESGGTPVAIRRPGKVPFLVVTNHYCVRRPPLDCARFERLTKALESALQDGRKLDLDQARKLLRSAELPLAAHTLVFCPDERRLTISITRDNLLSTRLPGVAFTWQELFSRQ
jgi:hypothetical protein